MATQQLSITTDWQKLSDGTQTKFLELKSGTIILHDAEAKPAANAPGHTISGSITISPPTVAWVKVSIGTVAIIIIS